MDAITLERKERIRMFFREYYFGVPTLFTLFRLIGGPVMFYVGLSMYINASDRFGIAYGGILVVVCVYYTFIPFWWILLKWKYLKTIHFQVEASPDKLIIKEDQRESQTGYSKFEKIIRRRRYFALSVQKGLKIYLPIEQLSEQTVTTLMEREK